MLKGYHHRLVNRPRLSRIKIVSSWIITWLILLSLPLAFQFLWTRYIIKSNASVATIPVVEGADGMGNVKGTWVARYQTQKGIEAILFSELPPLIGSTVVSSSGILVGLVTEVRPLEKGFASTVVTSTHKDFFISAISPSATFQRRFGVQGEGSNSIVTFVDKRLRSVESTLQDPPLEINDEFYSLAIKDGAQGAFIGKISSIKNEPDMLVPRIIIETPSPETWLVESAYVISL
jgi:hypothetical protein